VSKNIPEWQLLLEKKITPGDMRKEFVHSNTNSLNALGIVGRMLVKEHPENWKEKIRGLKNINWSRNNPEWEGRLLIKGRMMKNALGVELAANTILKKCGVSLSEDRLKHENKQ
jgi:DNA sulfur modification protein DndB